jgi:hypothetical protein
MRTTGPAAVILAALALGGCTTTDRQATAPATVPTTAAATQARSGAVTPAAGLRADLTTGLADQAFGIAALAEGVVDEGPRASAARAARRTVGRRAAGLAAVLDERFGPNAAREFRALWGDGAGLVATLAAQRRRGDSAAADRTRRELHAYAGELATYFEGLTDKLPAEDVAPDVRAFFDAQAEVVDAAQAGSPSVADAVRRTGPRAGALAERLAAGIVADRPPAVPGDPRSPAAALRADLTGALVADAYLLSRLLAVGLQDRFAGAGFGAARDAAAVAEGEVADAVDVAYGSRAGVDLQTVLRRRRSALLDYARGVADRDARAKRAALDELDGLGDEAGALLEGLDERLPAARTTEPLDAMGVRQAAALRAVAAGSPKAPERVADAARPAPVLAERLAGAIAAGQPDRFAG